MRNKLAIVVVICLIFMTACMPEEKKTIFLDNGDAVLIVNNNRTGLSVDINTMQFVENYQDHKFSFPFEIVSEAEKNRICKNHSFYETYENSSVLSAHESNDDNNIYYWLIPIEGSDEYENPYWIYAKANLTEIGMQEFMLGITIKEGRQADNISFCITAKIVDD